MCERRRERCTCQYAPCEPAEYPLSHAAVAIAAHNQQLGSATGGREQHLCRVLVSA